MLRRVLSPLRYESGRAERRRVSTQRGPLLRGGGARGGSDLNRSKLRAAHLNFSQLRAAQTPSVRAERRAWMFNNSSISSSRTLLNGIILKNNDIP